MYKRQGYITIIMGMYIRVNGKMEKSMVKEFLLGNQEIYTKVIGLVENVREVEL